MVKLIPSKTVWKGDDDKKVPDKSMLSEEKEFYGKSVVITGAAAGMGKSITEEFLKYGATVIAVDINKDALEQLKKEFTTKYGTDVKEHLIPFIGDISKQETNEAMIGRAIEATGEINILINNAGVAGHSEPITETTNDDWNRILQVDLNGPMFAIRAAVTKMIEQKSGGNIVTISSVAGLKGCRSSVAYSVAKHGLIGLCEHTAYAYMHKGIRSNIVCPGAIRTGMTSRPELESEFGRARIMSGMDSDFVFGQVQDIAQAVTFLASEKAKFINGAKLVVDGGISCN